MTAKDSFYKLFRFIDEGVFIDFCRNATVFFKHLPEQVNNTGMLTSMLTKTKKNIKDFAERTHNELEYLAKEEALGSLSSMNNGRGLPKEEDVKKMKGWEVWKVDGQFSMELFRAFSSMNCGKGLPKEEEVKKMKDWEVWKVDDHFSMELFRAFSSMNCSKGLPKEEDVKKVKGWEVWKVDGQFDMALFRAFSSMNNGKGLPKEEEVKKMKDWEVWKVDDHFSMELFRAFSSMNNGKGLPKEEEVKKMKDWEVWKVDGQFDMELFRAFSSMNNGKGLPKEEEVKKMKDWEVWKVDDHFSMELLRTFSSMNNGKGLPKEEDVKKMKDWEVWKVDGQFSMALFRAFSSMNCSKGLPKEEDVKKVKGWEVWKVDGQFNMALFRAFSSMNCGKGLPKEEDVKKVKGWEVWKVDGQFNMELFRTFSSMNRSKGLPKKEEDVKKVKGWEAWKADDQFSMELFRAFSSMDGNKGLPKKEEDVEKVKGWEVWKVDDHFSMELFRAFSSMNCGKGLPKEEEVKKMKDWEVWKVDDHFSMELFRAFSSMNCSKGLPKEEDVKKVKGWEVWKVDGQFDMALFRAFSSMNNGKGLPKEEEVKKMKDWEVWKVDDHFSMELFRAFSSMNCSKGLPKEEDVKKVKGWEVWKVDGQFSMELFRAFSSMNNGKGLPKEEDVKKVKGWEVWKVDGQFNMALFRAFSSMNHCKGLPKEEDVKKVKGWEVWKVDGQFSMALFRAFSSMNNGKGLPKEEDVKKMKDWEVWKVDGQFSMALFRAFSSMNSGQGLPKKEEDVKRILDWVSHKKSLLLLMTRLWASASWPSVNTLINKEKKLSELLLPGYSEAIEGDEEDEEKEERKAQIKMVVLFLTTSNKRWFLRWASLKQFHEAKVDEKNTELEQLTKLLSSYGGEGIIDYLNADAKKKRLLLSYAGKYVPLVVLNKAMDYFSSHDAMKQFIFFNKQQKSIPDKERWEQISWKLNELSSVLKHDYMKKLYWEILQPFSSKDQHFFLCEKNVQAILRVFPTLNVLKKLSKAYSLSWFKKLFHACIKLNDGSITREGIQAIFKGLLITQQPFDRADEIPDHFLSEMSETDNQGVMIRNDDFKQTTESLALYFIEVVMWELKDSFYTVNRESLEIENLDIFGEQLHCFPIPLLSINEYSIEISNWTMEQFKHFLKIIDLPKQYYFTKTEWESHCNPPAPVYIQKRMERIRQRKDAPSVTTEFKPLPFFVLTNLIKRNAFIKTLVWKSIDYHKDKFPKNMHSIVQEKMTEDTTACPQEIRESLENHFASIRSWENEECNKETEIKVCRYNRSNNQKENFSSIWKKLAHKDVFDAELLEFLKTYEDCMELQHISLILKKAHSDIDALILDKWKMTAKKIIEKKRKKDPFFITISEDEYITLDLFELL